MNRLLMVGGFGFLFLGLGLAGANLMPVDFRAPGDPTPSMRELSEHRHRLGEMNLRITQRLAMKQELVALWKSGAVKIDELIDQWVWLNNQKPWYTSALGIMYPGMSSRQIAMLQVLVEAEEWILRTVSPENLERAMIELSILREATASGSLPVLRDH